MKISSSTVSVPSDATPQAVYEAKAEARKAEMVKSQGQAAEAVRKQYADKARAAVEHPVYTSQKIRHFGNSDQGKGGKISIHA